MPKPVCVKCQRFYRPAKNGYLWIEGMPVDNAPATHPRGNEPGASECWKPYKLWISDLWQCEGCGSEVVTGHAFNPIAENYMPTFKGVCQEAQDRMGHSLLQVNDC
jgi:hypothetical protein